MTQSASNTSQEINGILKDYVSFLKEHKLSGGLWSLLSFFGLLIATNRIGTAFAFVAQMVSFGTRLLRKGMNIAGIGQSNEAADLLEAIGLKETAELVTAGTHADVTDATVNVRNALDLIDGLDDTRQTFLKGLLDKLDVRVKNIVLENLGTRNAQSLKSLVTNLIVKLENRKGEEDVKAALKKSARWFWFGIFPAIILVPIIFLPAGVFFWKWFGIIAGLYIGLVHSAFALTLAALAGMWSKALSVVKNDTDKVEVPRPTDLSQVKVWNEYKKAMRESPDTPAASIRVYGVRFAQMGLMLGLLMPLFWSLGSLVHLLAPLVSYSMSDGLAILTRVTAFMAILLLIWTVPMKNVRRGGVIYSTIIYVLVLATPVLYFLSGHVTSILPTANSVWGDVNRDLAHNAYDLRILENSLQNADFIVTDSGGIQYTHTVYPGLPKGDGYYGDVNGDGRFNIADLYYYGAFIGEPVQTAALASQLTGSSLGSLYELMNTAADITASNLNAYIEYDDGKSHGPPPIKPKQEWSSLVPVAQFPLYKQLADINLDQQVNEVDIETFKAYYVKRPDGSQEWTLRATVGKHDQPVGDVNGDFDVDDDDLDYLRQYVEEDGRPPVLQTKQTFLPAVASVNSTDDDMPPADDYSIDEYGQVGGHSTSVAPDPELTNQTVVLNRQLNGRGFFTLTIDSLKNVNGNTEAFFTWCDPCIDGTTGRNIQQMSMDPKSKIRYKDGSIYVRELNVTSCFVMKTGLPYYKEFKIGQDVRTISPGQTVTARVIFDGQLPRNALEANVFIYDIFGNPPFNGPVII